MKKIFHKILLGLGCIAILGSINKVTPTFSKPDITVVVEKESLTQLQSSILCKAPYFDGFPFDN